MIIKNEKVILRDFIESDIDDNIYWTTVETEWQLWDAPWEYTEGETFDAENYRKRQLEWLATDKDENRIRWAFQVCINNERQRHIGLVNSYKIDDNFEYTKGEGHRTIGIDIPDMASRRKGYATAAWDLFIQYLQSNGIEDIYTQTWSGNERVIGLINKIGFEECCRKENIRTVRGQLYDGLTFKLSSKKYDAFHNSYMLTT